MLQAFSYFLRNVLCFFKLLFFNFCKVSLMLLSNEPALLEKIPKSSIAFLFCRNACDITLLMVIANFLAPLGRAFLALLADFLTAYGLKLILVSSSVFIFLFGGTSIVIAFLFLSVFPSSIVVARFFSISVKLFHPAFLLTVNFSLLSLFLLLQYNLFFLFLF